MTTLMIAVLVALSGYLGMRLHFAATEISNLRASVAALKRRLNQR